MTGRRAGRSLLASVIFVALTAVPAYSWHGSGSITALAIDPLTPSTLYAGTTDRGVFKSVDGGATWTWTATGLTNTWVTSLAIDAQDPGIVYVGTWGGGVFKSVDGGETWSATNTGLTDLDVAVLVIDRGTPATLYALISYAGVFRSTDGGATWNASLRNDSISPFATVVDLTINSQTPSTLYAHVSHNSPEMAWGELWIGCDGATCWCPSWTTTEDGFFVTNDMRVLAIDPASPTTLYAVGIDWTWTLSGLFKSMDGGWNWTWLNASEISTLVVDPSNASVLYAGTPAGVQKSEDGGATWSVANSGLNDLAMLTPDVRTLAIDPIIPTTLYAGTSVGVFKSMDGGANWSPTGLIRHSPLASVSLSPTRVTGGTAATGTVGLLTPAPDGGAVVTLFTSDSTVAAVPATVTVPAGTTSATFMVSTNPVTNSTEVTISATFDDTSKSTSLTVTPPLAYVVLSPNGVAGGMASTGFVALGTPAPAGGAVVMLSSSNTAVATVPASVTVAEGGTNANFTVSTSAVTVSTTVTVSAAYSGDTKSAVLTVVPTTLSSVSLNPTSVPAGSTSTGTVTLSVPAPVGGAVVTLWSKDTNLATVPASVTVAAGATSADFTVSASAVLPPTYVSLSVAILAANGGVTSYAYLRVTLPPATTLSSLTVNPTSVTGGAPSTGTVTLSVAAPAGGAPVTLSSSDPAVATVPASVTVPAGATSANFTVSASAVASSTSVTISGAYGGVTRSAGLSVTPPTLISVGLAPTRVKGGTPATGTVTLSGPAPAGGSVVALASSNTAVATVPASVTVAAGATSANFAVSTRRVTASTTVTISATFDGVTRSTVLTVTRR